MVIVGIELWLWLWDGPFYWWLGLVVPVVVIGIAWWLLRRSDNDTLDRVRLSQERYHAEQEAKMRKQPRPPSS